MSNLSRERKAEEEARRRSRWRGDGTGERKKRESVILQRLVLMMDFLLYTQRYARSGGPYVLPREFHQLVRSFAAAVDCRVRIDGSDGARRYS